MIAEIAASLRWAVTQEQHCCTHRMSRLRVQLQDLGWQMRPGKGTHLVCRSSRGRNIPVPVSKNKVKREYLRLLLEEIELTSGDLKETTDDD